MVGRDKTLPAIFSLWKWLEQAFFKLILILLLFLCDWRRLLASAEE